MSRINTVDALKETANLSKLAFWTKYIQILEIVQNVMLSSTSHGIPNIIRSRKLSIKILWSFFTVLSACLCITLIVSTVLNYLKYEVTTTIRVKNEVNSIFPAITVCDLSSISSRNSVVFNETIWLEKEARVNLKKNRNYIEFIYSCIFDSTLCASNRFKYFANPNTGDCYTFNSGLSQNGTPMTPLTSAKIGRFKGLTMFLNVSSNTKKTGFNGAEVYIHEQRISPLSVEPIAINPGEQTTISIYKTIAKQKAYPYSDCEDGTENVDAFDSDLFKDLHRTTFLYSQKLCFELCFHKIMLEKCKCFARLFTTFEQGSPCLDLFDYSCCLEEYKKFVNSSYSNEICRPRCPQECESISYSKTTSSKKYSNGDLTSLIIHFDSLGYTQIEETPITDIVGLLSNIGGLAGLFLGLSVLSFVEIFEIFIEIFHIFNSK
ncbi:unnamed protein product [Brachionus calyciflorus]|uniref:Uncharacterized protein n=1 Tax=Brachionus calyciflorus TaxID=104777 RepID=A0A813LZ22_9BILA|nr:unnamed protein product [Brachionus calyciflorus]